MPEIAPLTRDQVREVDRRAVEEYGIHSLILMENAGRGCVDILGRVGIDGPVAILCGKGNNAGDGCVIARHLEIRGYTARVLISGDPQDLGGDAATNFAILQKCDVPIRSYAGEDDSAQLAETLDGVQWVVDALLGTGATGAPRPPMDAVIRAANEASCRRLAVDVPSGLDCDSGETPGEVFHADHTCTFVAAKPGLLLEDSKPYVGRLHVVDIGAPRKLVGEVRGT